MGFNGEGKIVARLRYGDNDANVVIPVRLIQKTGKVERSTAPWKGKGSKPRQTRSCRLRVYWEEVGLKNKGEQKFVEATDIEVLRVAVMERLDSKHKIEWKKWLLVTVSSGYRDSLDESNVKFKWDDVYIAHLPDGRTVHRANRHQGDSIIDGLPETGKLQGGERMVGLVRETDENVAALEELKSRLDELRGRMQKFLSPKEIEKTLATAAGRLLPSPAEKGRI